MTTALALVGLAGLPAALERPHAVDEPRVAPIRIDAVVTDAKGQPILDLKPGDFELRENGVLRPLATVELRTVQRAAAAADVSPIESDSDETRAARQPGTRVFALFLDEFHVSPGVNADRVRTALGTFVDSQLRPGDLATVVKPLDSLASLRFTRDRAALRSAIDSFTGRKGDYAARTAFEQTFIGHAPGAVQAARAQIATAGLRELALRFGELRADHGVFVVVSEGFARRTPVTRGARVPDLQGVVRAASRFNLPMYTFNPADTPFAPAEGAPTRDTPASTLEWLASQTGGQAVVDGRTITAGLRRMTDDLSAYYVLTYQSELVDGRFHPVEVRTMRRNAQVRTPPGFWAPLSTDWRTSLGPARFALARRALKRSALVDVWTGLTRDADGRTRLSVTWEPRGTARLPDVIALKAQTSSGRVLFDGTVSQVGAARDAADRAVFDVPAGRVELDLTILAADGATLDTDARDLEVPPGDPRSAGPTLFSPEVLRARTAREYGALSVNPVSTPTPDRAFSRSDRLLIRVPVWESTGAAVQLTVSILNRWGHPMRLLDRTPEVAGLALAQFDLPLAWLAPGDYVVAITGTSAGGTANDRVNISVR